MANNTVVGSNAVNDLAGGQFTGSYNLISDNSGSPNGLASSAHNLFSVDPALGLLADNGGPTQTIALLAGSQAIGAGTPSPAGNTITADQRGLPRPSSAPSIGAFEAGTS